MARPGRRKKRRKGAVFGGSPRDHRHGSRCTAAGALGHGAAPTGGAPMLTDDYAPVDRLLFPVIGLDP